MTPTFKINVHLIKPHEFASKLLYRRHSPRKLSALHVIPSHIKFRMHRTSTRKILEATFDFKKVVKDDLLRTWIKRLK